MTHGGLLSIMEAVYHAVPIIGIPVFGDQGTNIATGVSRGYAIKMPINNISEKLLIYNINEITNNPK